MHDPIAVSPADEARSSPILRVLAPPAPIADARERTRAVVGAALGIFLTGVVSRWLVGAEAGPWLVAPMGASAELVFCAPSSPLAQPWSVLVGNTVSAMIGVVCATWIDDTCIAASLAVSLAIATMYPLRALHPPGGASALFAVMARATSIDFAWCPVLVNSVLLVAIGLAWHATTGGRYPHGPSR